MKFPLPPDADVPTRRHINCCAYGATVLASLAYLIAVVVGEML